ncbi:hypothetical protein H0H92_014251, partial [Tricholoma furcatifolium]
MEPTKFDPTRYFPTPEGRGEPFPVGVWGFGRRFGARVTTMHHPLLTWTRICPGRYLADSSLWIAVVNVLSTLHISKTIGEDGSEITPEEVFTSAVT